MHFDGWVWGERPHTFHGCPYYKVESTTKVMPQDMYDERIRAHQPQVYAWERLAADGVTLPDLDEKLVRNCIRRGIDGGRIPETALYEPIGDILSKWKLLKNGVPTNGAVLLFSNNIDEYPQFSLRMARFVGMNKNMFRDNQRAEGNLFQLLDAGVAFCFKHLSLSGRITNHSLEREEQLEIPYHALREALINALCHRHWERNNLTISLAIYDDRIEIASPGAFPPQITPENIKKPHESYPHNLKAVQSVLLMLVRHKVWNLPHGLRIVALLLLLSRDLISHPAQQRMTRRKRMQRKRTSCAQPPTKYRSTTDQVAFKSKK